MKNKNEILQDILDGMTDEEKSHLGGKILASVRHIKSPKPREYYQKINKLSHLKKKENKLKYENITQESYPRPIES